MKNHLLTCWNIISLVNWIGCLIVLIAKIASKKNRTLICSMKFLSSEVVLYLY